MVFLPSLSVLIFTVLAQEKAPEKPPGAPLPPKSSAERMKLQGGLKVSLVASEPEILQPIALTTDAKGRLWVVECFSYPMWLKDPSKGRDRVSILEDKDGDGVFETRNVFLENGSNLSGIAVGMGGVWLCSTPNLVFVPDADGDDKPDGPPQILIDGFDMAAKHNVSSSLKWGPDGWLWGCNGILSNSRLGKPGTPDSQRLPINCGVFRFHPTRKVIEAVAHGTTNPWGLDFDQFGEAFITNCVIAHVWHVQPGGRFDRMFGNDLNPHAYALIPTIADHLHWGGGHWTSSRGGQGVHSTAGGGHAHAGAAIISGLNWPADYRESVLMLNIHGNRINRDRLITEGSTYKAVHTPDMVQSPDPWFRGVSLTTGPGDIVYFSDWSDTGECHNYDKADQTNGRVYRLGNEKNWLQKPKDLSQETDLELAKRQTSGGEWDARMARVLLQERASKRQIDDQAIEQLRSDYGTELEQVRRLWTLLVIGKLDQAILAQRAESNLPRLRGWAVRLAGETKKYDIIRSVSKTEKDPWVLGAIASTATQIPVNERPEILASLAKGPVFTQQAPRLLYWYAVEPVIASNPQWTRSFLIEAKDPLWVRFAAKRIAQNRSYSNNQDGTNWVLDLLLGGTLKGDSIEACLAGLNESLGLPGNPTCDKEKVSSLLDLSKESKEPGILSEAAKLAQLAKSDRAWGLTKRIVDDGALSLELRKVILSQPLVKPGDDEIQWLRKKNEDKELRLSSWVTRARFRDESLPDDILKQWKSLGLIERQQALEFLAERPVWAGKLLDQLESGNIAPRDLPVHVARQISSLNDKEIGARLEKAWGTVRKPQGDKAARFQEWRTKLQAIDLKNADLTSGARVFEQSCGACHKLFGKGADLGPELTGGQRQNMEYWLENLLDPSAVVPREFKMDIFELKNGRVISGAVQSETPNAIHIRTTNEKVTLAPADIESRRATNQSLMPEGQLERFTPAELRDLLGYLMSSGK